MAKENLYQPFEIELATLERFPKATRQNNFFELIYIVSGTGVQRTNGNRLDYRKGNLFLITPQDTNSFEVTTTTQFCFIRFNEVYVQFVKDRDWTERIEFILNNASHRPGCILKNQADKPFVASLVESIAREETSKQLYHHKIVQQMVNTIIVIVARNIALKLPKNIKENTGEVVLDILHYIQQNILKPKLLRVDEISRRQGISKSYLGRYFKKQTGETLQQYIARYKVRLIEIRLSNTDMRINEIADELNFADESHLNRVFRKYKGINPTEFRKKLLS